MSDTSLVRTLDADEAREALYDAHEDFVDRLERFERRHLVSDDALGKWYAPRPERNRARAIAEEFGEPVSTRLER